MAMWLSDHLWALCCAGLQFRKLISEINDTVQEYPEPLIDRCAGVITTVTPTAHQYASIAFMLEACTLLLALEEAMAERYFIRTDVAHFLSICDA
jgi:hypothetical protein